MKMHYEDENWPEFIKLKKKIEQVCTKKTFIIDDSLSNVEPFRDIETTNSLLPDECIKRGKKFLADNKHASSALSEFNTAASGLDNNDPLWGELYFYRSIAYSKRGKAREAEQDHKKAKALGFNKITVYELRTKGKRVKPGHFVDKSGQQSQRNADKFLNEYTKIIWYHFQNRDATTAQEITEESKQEILSELEKYLRALKSDYSQKAIKAIKDIVSKELDKPVKPTENKSPFISEKDKPESYRRQVDDNYTLANIFNLYRKHTDIETPRQIRINMARALDAVNFWPERMPGKGIRVEKYERRIKAHWTTIESLNESLESGFSSLQEALKPDLPALSMSNISD